MGTRTTSHRSGRAFRAAFGRGLARDRRCVDGCRHARGDRRWRKFLVVSRRGPRHPIHSLAVLSLSNLTGDAQQDYFVEGLSEALAAELSQIRSLSVISGRSASRFKDAQQSAIEIAKALKVDALVEGAVMRSGNRVRVTVHLVDGRTDRRIWTRSFDRELTDILMLCADIGRAVAAATSATISDQRPTRPVNAKAYEAYLRGRYFCNRWMYGGCLHAEPYFLEAIALDPNFAPSYAARAFCYAFPDRVGLRGAQILPIARAAAARASSSTRISPPVTTRLRLSGGGSSTTGPGRTLAPAGAGTRSGVQRGPRSDGRIPVTDWPGGRERSDDAACPRSGPVPHGS